MTLTRTTRTATVALLLVLATLGGVVAGCTDSSDGPASGTDADSSSQNETEGPDDDSDADRTGPDPVEVSTTVDALVTAGHAAQDLVPGSIVVELDHELPGDYWEVELHETDGSAHDVKVSADGTQVIEGPTADSDRDADLSRRRAVLQSATVDFETAARAIENRYPGSMITEMGLDDSGDLVVWDADVVDADGTSHEIAVDAASGELLSDGVHG